MVDSIRSSEDIESMEENRISKTSNVKSVKKVEDVREVLANGIKTINIETDEVDVIVKVGVNEPNISAHFYSDTDIENIDVYSLVRNPQDSVNLTLNIGRHRDIKGNFYVELRIPKNHMYCMYVHSNNGSIHLNSDGYIKKLWLDSTNGNIYFRGYAKEISSFTYNGNVNVSIFAKGDTELDAKTSNGLIEMELHNVSINQLILDTRNGRIKERFSGNGDGYTVYGRAASHNGNITVW